MGRRENGIEKSSSNSGGRFNIENKPQFRKPKETTSKIVIDDRFASALTDPRFQLDIKDKYGRKKSKKASSLSASKEQLSAFYTIENAEKDDKKQAPQQSKRDKQRLDGKNTNDDAASNSKSSSDSSFDSSGEENEITNDKTRGKSRSTKINDNVNDETSDAENLEDPRSRIEYLRALSRGELDLSSSSDEEDGSDLNDDGASDDEEAIDADDEDVMGKVGVLDPSSRLEEEVELKNISSPYIAIMNLDWSHIRAIDIYAIVSSFTPAGAVKQVQVFPSNFGLERMAMDEKFGPVHVFKDTTNNDKKKVKQYNGSTNDENNDVDDNEDDDGDDNEDEVSDNDDVDDNGANDSDEDSLREINDTYDTSNNNNASNEEGGFDPEKLRAYEASKLKYYFAVVHLASPEFADIAYKEIDGIEFEHSSAAADVRMIPRDEIDDVVAGRTLRDEATSLPSNYKPPDFVVSALQQSNVQCSWEAGDTDREKALTKYTTGQAWEAMAESDDIKAYLASDDSSDDDDNDNSAVDTTNGKSKKKVKASNLRKMLGLDSDEEEDDDNDNEKDKNSDYDNNKSDSSSDESSSDGDERDNTEDLKEVTFIPGQTNAKKTKDQDEIDTPKNLTPWEKYLEKKKQKRKEKRQSLREKRKEINSIRKQGDSTTNDESEEDEFFVNGDDKKNTSRKDTKPKELSKDELALLVAGDDDAEETRNFDMRVLERIEKNKDKKLRGARKRKEEKITSNVTGTEFKIDFDDDRFRNVVDGSDPRFGIDRTDPNFKETPGMRELLREQTRRRKKNKTGNSSSTTDKPSANNKMAVPDVSANSSKISSGASALSALVTSLKAKVK